METEYSADFYPMDVDSSGWASDKSNSGSESSLENTRCASSKGNRISDEARELKVCAVRLKNFQS